ncbi:MAG TPA: serine hydrolase [Gemmatimonadaceae bacterium]|nr:serine hydrolase [Gemmatimonadaceae bacterium]
MRILVAIAALALPASAISQATPAVDSAPYVYTKPPRIDDGWDVATLRDVGIDSARMASLVDSIRGQRLPNLHSVLVVRRGKLAFEEYFAGSDERRGQPIGTVRFDRATLHDLRSVTKSVTSALLGIAFGNAAVKMSDRVLTFFPRHAALDTGMKRAITVRHLLTMTSGLEWDETSHPYTDARNSETAMDLSASSVRYVLEQKVVAAPGSQFRYCGGCTMLLAGIVRHATGKQLDAFASEHLFRPLGISRFEWLHHRDGLPIAASGLRLRPRDMAKIGYLYTNRGRWRGRQVLPEHWVAEASRAQVSLDSTTAYGYQWWIDYEGKGDARFTVLVARGNGGQRIYVVPHLDLVAVITAGNYNSPAGSRTSEQAFWRYILPAAMSGR